VFAQNVTLYGVADVGIKNDGSTTKYVTGINGSPRIGVKGSEDLGGGLKANFLFESNVDMTTGDKATAFGDRGAIVGISGGFGSIDAGASMLTPSFWASAAIDASTTNNYSLNHYNGATRLDNVIGYTGAFGGLTARAAVVMSDNTASGKNTIDVSGVYGAGPVTVSAAYSDNGAADGYFIGAAYNMGMAKLSASYVDSDLSATKNSWRVGVQVPMGATTLQLDTGRTDDAAGNAKSRLVGSVQYALSKSSKVTAYASKKGEDADAVFGVGLRKNF
jgi:predicted porin